MINILLALGFLTISFLCSCSQNNEVSKSEKIKVFQMDKLTPDELYLAKCSTCHSMEDDLIGPSMSMIIQKYKGKNSELIDFILNPKRVNEKYPRMPKLSISEDEAKIVTEYILVELK